jgi:selenoprotein W-related protein
LTDELLKEFEPHIRSLSVQPSEGGVFEVTVNDELLFSKKKEGRHALAGEIAALVRARLRPDAAR